MCLGEFICSPYLFKYVVVSSWLTQMKWFIGVLLITWLVCLKGTMVTLQHEMVCISSCGLHFSTALLPYVATTYHCYYSYSKIFCVSPVN